MSSKYLYDCSDDDILHIISVNVPQSGNDRVHRYRRTGATRVWKNMIANRMRFHIPLKFGLYINTYVDNNHLLFDTGNWPRNTFVELSDLVQPVRMTGGSTFVPKNVEELHLRG